MSTADIVIIILYFAVLLAMGFISGRKQKDSESFILGSKNLKALPVCALWMSSWIGGSSVVGTASGAHAAGISGAWYMVVVSVSCLLFGLLMASPAKRMASELKSVTLTDMLGARYDSRSQIMAAVCSASSCTACTVAQYIAGASILSVMTNWSYSLCYVITVAVILFVTCGGMKAIASTDNLQMLILLLGIIIIGPITISSFLRNGGFSLEQLPKEYFDPLNGTDTRALLALAASTVMCIFVSMDSYTRCIAAKNTKSAKLGAILAAGGCMLLALSAAYMGLAGKLVMPDISSNDCVAAVILRVFPNGLKGLVLVGVICAIISSADILILVGSANICNDIYMHHVNPNADGKKMLHMNTGASIVIGLVAAVLGWRNSNIIEVLLISYTINSAGLFLPVVGAFFWKRSCADASFVSMLTAAIICVVWFIGGAVTDIPLFKTEALWPAFIVSTVLYFGICLVHRQSDDELARAGRFLMKNKS